MKRFAVLDRDGTILVEKNYLLDPGEVELSPGAGAGLRRMAELGLGLVVVTNQSAVGRGWLEPSRLDSIHQALRDRLAEHGVALDGIYTCPHAPEEGCSCRKPATQLLERAAQEQRFDPAACFVIGDKACDIELGRRAGATTILVATGYGTDTSRDASVRPDHFVKDLPAAAGLIGSLLGNGPAPGASPGERDPA